MPYIPSITNGLINNASATNTGLVDTTGNTDWVFSSIGVSNPAYSPTSVNGRPGLHFIGNAETKTLVPVNPTPLDNMLNTGNYTMFFVQLQKTWMSLSSIIESEAANKRLWLIIYNGNQFGLYPSDHNNGPVKVIGDGLVTGQTSIIDFSFQSDSPTSGTATAYNQGPWGRTKLYENHSTIGAMTTTNWHLCGSGDYGSKPAMYLAQVIIYNRVLSDNERLTVCNEIDSYFEIGTKRPPANFVFDGNSFWGSTGPLLWGEEFPQVTLRNIESAKSLPPYTLSSRSLSFGGKNLNAIAANDYSTIQGMYVPGALNIYSMFDFQNIAVGNDNTQTDVIYNTYKNCLQSFKSAGWKVLAWNAGAYVTQNETQRIYLNNKIKADFISTGDGKVWKAKPGTTYADYMLNVGDDPYIGPPGNASYLDSGGNGHPTALGMQQYSIYLQAGITNLLTSTKIKSTFNGGLNLNLNGGIN